MREGRPEGPVRVRDPVRALGVVPPPAEAGPDPRGLSQEAQVACPGPRPVSTPVRGAHPVSDPGEDGVTSESVFEVGGAGSKGGRRGRVISVVHRLLVRGDPLWLRVLVEVTRSETRFVGGN